MPHEVPVIFAWASRVSMAASSSCRAALDELGACAGGLAPASAAAASVTVTTSSPVAASRYEPALWSPRARSSMLSRRTASADAVTPGTGFRGGPGGARAQADGGQGEEDGKADARAERASHRGLLLRTSPRWGDSEKKFGLDQSGCGRDVACPCHAHQERGNAEPPTRSGESGMDLDGGRGQPPDRRAAARARRRGPRHAPAPPSARGRPRSRSRPADRARASASARSRTARTPSTWESACSASSTSAGSTASISRCQISRAAPRSTSDDRRR